MTKEDFIIAFDTGYAVSEKHTLKGTPLLEFEEYFEAKYGCTMLEAEYKMRDKKEYDHYSDRLNAWYVHYLCCADEEEASGYHDNDIDCWNDYLRDWEKVNKED